MKKISIIIIAALIIINVTGCKEKKLEPGIDTGKAVAIPEEIQNNKYGFLVGGPDEGKQVTARGGAWARPHPGPFLWDAMQASGNDEYNFEAADQIVKNYQENNIGLLATIWPFANWDQLNRADASNCKVPDTDEFLLPDNFFKPKDIGYLPLYRCNPNNWEAYKQWVQAIVERYDGDGIQDMPGLEIPIKYWEVLNEPDLGMPEEHIPQPGERTLDFYLQDPIEYAELLKKTYTLIKETDSSANVLIAGAAGGNKQFLGFYKELFQIEGVIDAFDIGNVHCISNDDYQSFNLEPYLELLKEFDINKTVWVTESEAIISDDPDVNATQTYYSTKRALELGAEKVFFTRNEFTQEKHGKPEKSKHDEAINIEPEISGQDGVEAYKIITSQ